MRKKHKDSTFEAFLATLKYEHLNHYLVPFYLIIDIAEEFSEGILHEDLVMDYFFSDLGYHSDDEISTEDLIQLIQNQPIDQKQYLLDHLPKFQFPFTQFIYSLLKDDSIPVRPEVIPDTIRLYEWFQIMIKELYEEVPLDNTEFIHQVLKDDHVHLFKAYVESGDIPLTLQTYLQESLLHEAVKFEAKEILSYLLTLGMNVNQQDYYGSTPLFIACAKGYIEGFDILRYAGGNLALANKEGIKPLEMAVFSDNLDFFIYLHETLGFSLKMLINGNAVGISVFENKVKCIKYFIEKGKVDIFTERFNGISLLELALEGHNLEFTQWILSQPNYQEKLIVQYGYPFIHQVVMHDFIEMIPYLKEKAYDFNSVTANNETLLEVSVRHLSQRFFKYLIQNSEEINDDKLLGIACFSMNIDVLRYLKAKNVNFNQLLDERISPFLKLSQQYLKKLLLEFIDLIDFQFHNYHRVPLLIDTTFHNDLELTLLYLEKGANPNIPIIFGKKRFYPLLNAIYHHNFEMVEALVENGALINVQTEKGITPLLYALWHIKSGKKVFRYLWKLHAPFGKPFFLGIGFILILISLLLVIFL